MSLIQLISDEDNSASFRVNFSDTIHFKESSKLALVQLTTRYTFNVNMDMILNQYPSKTMYMYFKVGTETATSNVIRIPVSITKDNFTSMTDPAIDIYNVTLDDLLRVLQKQFDSAMKLHTWSGNNLVNSSVYNMDIKKMILEGDRLGMRLTAQIDNDKLLHEDMEDYEIQWSNDAGYKANVNLTNPFEPKSQSDTTTSAPCYCVTENAYGMDINGGYFFCNVATIDKTWSLAFSHFDLSFSSSNFFDIDDTDKTEIYCPIVLKCLGDKGDDDYCTLKIYKHEGDVAYSTTPTANDRVLIGTEYISIGSQIEVWFNANATALVRISTGGHIIDYEIKGLHDTYLYTKTMLKSKAPAIVLYTTNPSIYPVINISNTAPNYADADLDDFLFHWELENDNLFLPLTIEPADFSNLLGFRVNNTYLLRATDQGLFTLDSEQSLSTSNRKIDNLNVHIVNLPLVSYKNVPKQNSRSYNGYETTLLRDVPLLQFGNMNYAPPNLIYVDLKNPPELINDLQIEIRDATTNKITRILDGTSILTLHLI